MTLHLLKAGKVFLYCILRSLRENMVMQVIDSEVIRSGVM